MSSDQSVQDEKLKPYTTVVPLENDAARARPIPRKFAYPSRFGLANAVSHLTLEYGRIGAINILIEMAEMLEQEKDYLTDTISRRLVIPGVYTDAK